MLYLRLGGDCLNTGTTGVSGTESYMVPRMKLSNLKSKCAEFVKIKNQEMPRAERPHCPQEHGSGIAPESSGALHRNL